MKDQVVVVTGASAGLGRAIATQLGERGARVGLIARGNEGLAAARKEVEASGGVALEVSADVSDAGQVEAAATRVEDDLGPIDVWINNAMVSVFQPVWELDPADVKRVTEVTYLGYAYGTMTALRRMMPRDRGTIVQVGSALAYRGIPLQSAYCGAKHAIQGFTESVRCELLHEKSGVRVTSVQMPALNTPQFHWVKTSLPMHPQPVPPMYQPEVGARAVLDAIDGNRSEYWMGWPTVATLLANKVAPRLLDRYLGRTGFDGQQADFPIEPQRAHNLYAPIEGDHGAHGEFDDRAKASSLQWWLNTNRSVAALSVSAIGAVAGFASRAWNARPRT